MDVHRRCVDRKPGRFVSFLHSTASTMVSFWTHLPARADFKFSCGRDWGIRVLVDV